MPAAALSEGNFTLVLAATRKIGLNIIEMLLRPTRSLGEQLRFQNLRKAWPTFFLHYIHLFFDLLSGVARQTQCVGPNVLRVADMEPLAPYILQIIHSGQPIDPSLLHECQIFRSLDSTPCLDKSRTNRIMIYFGSFNPPHRGHLNLLKFAFLQGGPNLNLVAAIGIFFLQDSNPWLRASHSKIRHSFTTNY